MKNVTVIAALLAANGPWNSIVHYRAERYCARAVIIARNICKYCGEDLDAEVSFALSNLDDVLIEATDVNTAPF